MIIDETVPNALVGERLDRLVALLANVSRADAAALLASGAVTLNGSSAAKPSVRVTNGDRLRIAAPDPGTTQPLVPAPDVALDIVYVDDHVIVVDKPAGLVVHPGAGNTSGTLANALVARFEDLADVGTDPSRPGIVHRLDKGTSGLLVVARSQEAYDVLVAMMGARTVERTYRTLVWGHPASARGVVDAPIGRSDREPTKMAVSARGRPARTGYQVMATFDDPGVLAALTCRLETGRTHQIRVHLAAIGHPVVGDDRYGRERAELQLDRPFLHAAELAFDHPVTGEPLRFTSRLPPALQSVLDRCRSG